MLVSELFCAGCGVCSLPLLTLGGHISLKMELAVIVAAPSHACCKHMEWRHSDGPQKYIPGGKGGAFSAILEEGNALPDLLNSEARTRFV